VRARSGRVPDGRLGPPALRLSFETLKLLLLGLAAAYVAVAGLVWALQERLIFLPPPPRALPPPPAGWRIEPASLSMRDGTRLAGAWLLPPMPRPPLVIYFGGNAEDATLEVPTVEETYGERAVLLVNYRGYGASEGRPGEAAMVEDAKEIFDAASRREDIDATRIAVHGRSLGSGVAVPLAAARPVRCVVLTSPFAAALDVAREVYPWLPVALLMRHPFDSARIAPGVKAPALILLGEADRVIPPHHARRLAQLWGGPVRLEAFAGFGHEDISLNPRYSHAIRAFLDRCL